MRGCGANWKLALSLYGKSWTSFFSPSTFKEADELTGFKQQTNFIAEIDANNPVYVNCLPKEPQRCTGARSIKIRFQARRLLEQGKAFRLRNLRRPFFDGLDQVLGKARVHRGHYRTLFGD